MHTAARIAGVLTGLTLTLGGVAFAAPAAHADIPACTNMVQQAGVQSRTPSGRRAPKVCTVICGAV